MPEHSTSAPIPEQPQVEYKDIPGFPGYRVGSDGSVWSCWRRHALGGRAGILRVLGERWRQLVPLSDSRGRLSVKLCRGGQVTRHFIHHLVLEAFVGPCPDGMECCHFPDRSPGNNAPSNLRWDTKQANAADKLFHGTDPKGGRNGRAKLTAVQIAEGREAAVAGESRRSLAVRFGVARTTIDFIVNGGTWKHLLG